MKQAKGGKPKKRTSKIILLEDLAPLEEVKGGAGKIVFGIGATPFLKEEEKKPKKM